MKKLVVVVVLVVLLLVLAPLGIGKLAEKRLDQGLDKLVETAPYLKIVERKSTVGWYKSEQLVTFEISEPWLRAMSPKAIQDAMKKEAASGDAAESGVDAAVTAAPDAIPEDAPPENPDPTTASEPAAADAPEPVRVTVRNEILHGPVLGLSGLGVARVDSHLVLSDEMSKKITGIFGTKDPLEVSTRIGFFGGGTTTFKSEGR